MGVEMEEEPARAALRKRKDCIVLVLVLVLVPLSAVEQSRARWMIAAGNRRPRLDSSADP